MRIIEIRERYPRHGGERRYRVIRPRNTYDDDQRERESVRIATRYGPVDVVLVFWEDDLAIGLTTRPSRKHGVRVTLY
jgi:hypothetical protein